MGDVVKKGLTIQIPSSCTDGPCFRCGAEDADEKLVDVLLGAWMCSSHRDDDWRALHAHILARLQRDPAS